MAQFEKKTMSRVDEFYSIFLKGQTQTRPHFVYLRPFSMQSQIYYNWKKRRWSAWDSNLGLQEGRHR